MSDPSPREQTPHSVSLMKSLTQLCVLVIFSHCILFCVLIDSLINLLMNYAFNVLTRHSHSFIVSLIAPCTLLSLFAFINRHATLIHWLTLHILTHSSWWSRNSPTSPVLSLPSSLPHSLTRMVGLVCRRLAADLLTEDHGQFDIKRGPNVLH